MTCWFGGSSSRAKTCEFSYERGCYIHRLSSDLGRHSRFLRAMISPVGLTVLRWLARHDSASAPAIGAACAMAPRGVRFHLASLASLHFVASRLGKAKDAPCLIYFATDEGRVVAGISDMGMHHGSRGDPVTAAGKAV